MKSTDELKKDLAAYKKEYDSLKRKTKQEFVDRRNELKVSIDETKFLIDHPEDNAEPNESENLNAFSQTQDERNVGEYENAAKKLDDKLNEKSLEALGATEKSIQFTEEEMIENDKKEAQRKFDAAVKAKTEEAIKAINVPTDEDFNAAVNAAAKKMAKAGMSANEGKQTLTTSLESIEAKTEATKADQAKKEIPKGMENHMILATEIIQRNARTGKKESKPNPYTANAREGVNFIEKYAGLGLSIVDIVQVPAAAVKMIEQKIQKIKVQNVELKRLAESIKDKGGNPSGQKAERRRNKKMIKFYNCFLEKDVNTLLKMQGLKE